MAFPANEKDLEVCFAYGANLATSPTALAYGTNLAPTRIQPRLTISRGRINGATQTQPTTISFGLKNPKGEFSPRNIVGPHYGQLRRNTPVRARLDPGGGMVTRGFAYMPDWPTRWTGPDIEDQIPMEASGALRQIGSGKEPRSAPRRYLPGTSPVAVWPLEDGELVDSGVADVGGYPLQAYIGPHPSGAVFTTPQWSSATLASWLPAVLGLSGNRGISVMWAPVAMPGFTSAWTIDLYYRADADSNRVWLDVNPSYLPGGAGLWPQLFFNAVGREIVIAHADGSPESVTSVPGLYDNRLHHVRWTMAQSGPNAAAQVWVDGVSVATSTSAGAVTVTAMQAIALGAEESGDTGTASVAVGYLGVWTSPPTLSAAVLVSQGWAGEKAADRIARLAAEEGIHVDIAAGDSSRMGPQSTSPVLDLFRECEDTDGGTLIDRRTGELGYDPRSSRYNRSAVLTVDYVRQIADLLPDDGDRDLVNYVTLSRIDGASATVEITDGPLGTNLTTGVGRYPSADVRLSLETDDQVVHHASYLARKGTVDEPRYTVCINLRAHPELITQWLACDVGSRIVVNNPPAIQVGPAPLDLLIDGYTELIDGVEWTATIYATPYRINEVFQIEGAGNRGRIAAGVSTTDLAYSATATSLSITSALVRWVDSAAYATRFPLVIEIAGEVMTCTSITGTGLTQTFTVQRGLHGVSKPLPINSLVQIWRPAAIAL